MHSALVFPLIDVVTMVMSRLAWSIGMVTFTSLPSSFTSLQGDALYDILTIFTASLRDVAKHELQLNFLTQHYEDFTKYLLFLAAQ